MLVIFVCCVILLYFLYRNYHKSPPGPIGLPVIGYYPFLGKDPTESLHQLSKQYGDITSINLLGVNFWILNSFEAIEEALVAKGDIFSGRPSNEYSLFKHYAGNTVIYAEGDEWKTQNRFVLAHFSLLGMGKSEFDATVHNLLDGLDQYIALNVGHPHNYSKILNNFSLNLLSSIVMGKQYRIEDKEFDYVEEWSTKFFEKLEYLNTMVSGDVLKYYFKLKSNYEQDFIGINEEMWNYAKKIVEERMKTFDAKNCRDLLDYWLKEIEQGSKYFTMDNLPQNLFALISSAHTTASILSYSFHLMAANPKIQEKVFEEIDAVIGTERDFNYSEMDRLHYTRAVVAEILRYVMLTPFTMVHVNTVPTKLREYEVPKRQKVIANLYAVSRNPKYFSNPNEFDPGNFLDENDNFKPSKAHIPFGVGYRKCLGFKVAEVAMFVAFVRFMLKYEWSHVEQAERPKAVDATVRFLAPFEVRATRRV